MHEASLNAEALFASSIAVRSHIAYIALQACRRWLAGAVLMAANSTSRPAKQRKLDPEIKLMQGNVIIQFQTPDGQQTGPQLSLPHDTTPEQLEKLLNGLLSNNEAVPYSFYINDEELLVALAQQLQSQQASVEAALPVVYQPRALFRVRPVTRCSSSIAGHNEAVLDLRFNPEGTRLASGSGDTTVRIWDALTYTPIHTCNGHKTWVFCVAWSPDGAFIASGDKSGLVMVWQPITGKCVASLKGHSKWVTSIAWEPLHRTAPCRRLCSGSKDNTVRVWDVQKGVCLFSMSSHTNLVSAVKWGGQGLIYSGSRDTNIHVWDDSCGKLVRALKGHAHFVNALALSSEHALRTGAFDTKGQSPKDVVAAQQAAQQRYDELTGNQPERLVSGSDDFTMFLWRPGSEKAPLARMTGHVQLINDVRFSPDGRWIVSASFDKAIKLWNGVTGTFVATLRAHVGPVYQVAWSADSRMLLSGSKDSTLKVWDVQTRKLAADLPGHADEVYTVDWAPTGRAAASGGKDRVLKIWHH